MRMLSGAIARWCKQNSDIKEELYCIVEYGIELFLDSGLKIVGLLVLGVMFGRLDKMLVVLLILCTTRYFAGGVHCKTHIGCFVSMLSICGGSIGLSEISYYLPEWIMGIMMLFAVSMVVLYAPRNSQINPILDQAILGKKKIRSILCAGLVSIFSICSNELDMKWLVATPLFIEAVTISPIFYRRKTYEYKKHEE